MVVRFVNKPAVAEIISAKQFKQIAQTDDPDPSEDSPNAKFLTKKNHKTDKETRAKKTDKFKNQDPSGNEIPSGGKGFGKGEKKSIVHKGGESSTDDDLGDIKIGPKTIINGKEYKYFTYFDRIRQAVADRWHPLIRKAIELVKHKKDFKLDTGQKITVIEVTINKSGEIIEYRQLQSSGIKEFDDVAHDAFYEAQPFSGPPDDLLEGHLSFVLPWHFTIDVGEAPVIEFGGINP